MHPELEIAAASATRPRIVRLLGRLWFIAGCLILVADGLVLMPGLLPYRPWGSFGGVLVALVGLAATVWGITTVRAARHEWATNANLLLLSVTAVSPVLIEMVFRGGIALGLDQFRRPGLYANYDSEDDYWKLRALWGLDRGGVTDIAGQLDPDFGWAPAKSAENPLGILGHGAYTPNYDGDVILFYGDSFVAGARQLEPGTRVSYALERALAGRPVYNYAGGGYGVDQIVLRFRATHRLFMRPILIFGILPSDLDRSVLTFRSGAKPYFVLEGNELRLRGTPVLLDPAQYVAAHPPIIRSYLFSYARQQVRRLAAGGDLAALTHRRDEKERINRAIIESAVSEVRSRGLPMLWVLFQSPKEFNRPSWREVFLLSEFQRLEVPMLDTRDVIRSAAREAGAPIEAYFVEDGHPNGRGNETIAAADAREITRLDGQMQPETP